MSEGKQNLQKIYLYNINGVRNKSAIKIKPIGSFLVEDPSDITDEHIKTIKIREDVFAHVFKPKVSDVFIASTKKYPVLYTVVEYFKNLIRARLFRLYLYFNVEDTPQNEKDLLTKPVSGKFNFEVELDDDTQVLDSDIGIYPGVGSIVGKFEEMIKLESMNEVIDDLIQESENVRKKQFGDMFEGLKIPKATIRLDDYLESDSN